MKPAASTAETQSHKGVSRDANPVAEQILMEGDPEMTWEEGTETTLATPGYRLQHEMHFFQ